MPLNWFDSSILHFLNAGVGASYTLDALVALVEESDLLKGGVVLAFYVWAWFRESDVGGGRRLSLISALAAGVAAIALCRGITAALPFRPRPVHAGFDWFTVPAGMENRLDGWSSFPSDHATMFFALAAGLWAVSRRAGWWSAVWAAVVISLPRVYTGLHYPTDIAAGALLGVSVAAAFQAAGVKTFFRRVLALESRRPGLFYAAAFLALFEMACLFDHVRTFGSFGAGVAKHTIKIMMGMEGVEPPRPEGQRILSP